MDFGVQGQAKDIPCGTAETVSKDPLVLSLVT